MIATSVWVNTYSLLDVKSESMATEDNPKENDSTADLSSTVSDTATEESQVSEVNQPATIYIICS